MIMYRQKDGSGCPYLLIDAFSLSAIVREETVKFYKECPEQFKQIEKAGNFEWATMTMLANRIRKRVAEEELK